MRAKLLKKLRKEILRNTDIHWYSQWSGWLSTKLDGREYNGRSHSPIGLANPNIAAKELEHIVLTGYLSYKKK